MNLKVLQETPPWDWPADAKEIFKKTLMDRRADLAERVIAAEMAGNMVAINDELAEALLSIASTSDEPEELRGSAAIALGAVLEQAADDEFEDPDDVPIREETFDKLQDSLQLLFVDTSIPKSVRRRVLEASVRAPEEWHREAIQAAYSSGDSEWVLTAVFSMGYVRGFDKEILESLNSPDPEIHFQAVDAAGTWELEAAWPHVLALVENDRTPKLLKLAAIEAVATIRPKEAFEILDPFTLSPDEDIKEAAEDAIELAEGMAGWENDDDEEDHPWVN